MNMKLIHEYETRAAGGSSVEAASSVQPWLLTQGSPQSNHLALTSALPMSDLQDVRPKLAYTKSTPLPESRGQRLRFTGMPSRVQPAPERVEVDEWDTAPSFGDELYDQYMYSTESRDGEGFVRDYHIADTHYRLYLNGDLDIVRSVEVIYEPS